MPHSIPVVGEPLIDRRYRVRAVLGRGAMGEVLLVEDVLRQGRLVALKRLMLETPEALAAFRREFILLQELHHPNIARVYDFGAVPAERQPAGSIAREVYFTSEHVPGRDLAQAARGAPIEAVLELLAQVCRGLSYVHARGIIHGDLKPANVLVVEEELASPDGPATVKLIDFGLAMRASRAAAPGLRGTARYMAPELAREGPFDHRVDLYALGATIYEVLTGEPLFAGTAREVLQQHQDARPPRPSRLRPDLPPELDALCLALCEKDPAARPPSAAQVIEVLGLARGRPFPIETATTSASYARAGSLVGRDPERAQLERWLAAGTPPLALIEGPVGAGKSRLAAEIAAAAQLEARQVLEVRCDPGAFAYGPLAEATARLITLAGPEGHALAGAEHALLLRFAGLGRPRSEAPALEPPPEGERGRLYAAVTTFLFAAAWRRPLLLLIHDLHRADASTLALLAAIARTLGAAERARQRGGQSLAARAARASGAPPIAMAATLRPEELEHHQAALLDALAGEGLAMRMGVPPLDPGGTRALLEALVGPPIGGALVERIHRQTGGNPFFVVEVVRAMLERSGERAVRALLGPSPAPPAVSASARLAPVTHSGRLAPQDLDGLRAPESIQSALGRRLARLGEDARAVLAALAAARRPQPEGVIAAAAELPAEGARAALAQLTAQGLVEERAGKRGGQRFGLRHDLLAESALEGRTAAERVALFARVAEGIEAAIASGEVHGDFALLAAAFHEAERPARTFHYATIAAHEAAGLYALDRAAELYELALTAAAAAGLDDAQVVDTLERLGRVRDRTGDPHRAAACYRSALDALEGAAERAADKARIYRRLGDALGEAGDPDAALLALGEGLRALGDALEGPDAAPLLASTAAVFARLGAPHALDYCARAAALVPTGSPELARIRNIEGVALARQGALKEAAERFEESLALRDAAGERDLVARTLLNLGAVYSELGQHGRAVPCFERALELVEGLGDGRTAAEVAAHLGGARLALGEHDRALGCLEQSLELAGRLGDAEALCGALARLARHDTERGMVRDAATWLDRAEPLRAAASERAQLAHELERGRLLAVVGATDEALERLSAARAEASRLGSPREEADALRLEGNLRLEAGDLDLAERALAAALGRYRKLGNRVEAAATGLDVVRALCARGEHALARGALEPLEQEVVGLRALRLYPALKLAGGLVELAASLGGAAPDAADHASAAALLLEEARRLADEDRRPELAWRAGHALARAYAIGGAHDRALKAAVRAMQEVQALYDRVPEPLAASYLALPTRQRLRADFLALREGHAPGDPAA